jgi:hypothetical protein
MEPKGLVDAQSRRRFLNRLCALGILRERGLIEVHRVAQARRIAPEEAVVLLGFLTGEQAAVLLAGERPFGFALEGLGIV